MGRIILIFILLGLYFSISVFAQDNKIIVKKKEIVKHCNVSLTDTLVIANECGNITVHTSDTKDITVTVTESGKALTAKRAQTILDNLNLKELRKDGKIYFGSVIKTPYNRKNGGINGIGTDKEGRTIMEANIDYVINIPKNIPLRIENHTGVVYLDDFNGYLDLKIERGTLHAKNISGGRNNIAISPNINLLTGEGDHVNTIDYVASGNIYSDMGPAKLIFTKPVDTTQVMLSGWDTVINGGVAYPPLKHVIKHN